MKPKYRVRDEKQKVYLDPSTVRIDGRGKIFQRCYGESKWVKADHLIIEWFIGLLDKNGMKIFEGDILGGANASGDVIQPFEVKFEKGMWIFFDTFDGFDFTSTHCAIEMSYEFERIGTIHDADLKEKE